MNRRLGILMLGGARRVSVGRMFVVAAAALGYDVELYSYELDSHVPVASIATVVIGRRWNDVDIMDDLRRVVGKYGISIMIPFVDGAIEIAARFCRLNPEVWSPVSAEDSCRRMFDKLEADTFFRQCGIAVPDRIGYSEARTPAIAKPRMGSASKGIAVLRTADDFSRLSSPGDYLIQEYIANREEYTVDCYVGRDRQILAAVPRRRVEVIGGEVTRTVTVADPRIESFAREVLEKTRLVGAVTLQFIHDLDSGRLMLMEINPRLGGGVVCSVHAGADIPAMIVREWAGVDQCPCSWRAGVEIVRYFQEIVFSTTDNNEKQDSHHC